MIKSFWQRLLGKKQVIPVQKPDIKVKPRELPTDAEYESLFLQLLDGVNNEGWSRASVKAFLDWRNIVKDDFVGWLRRFGERLLAGDGKNRELAQRMVRLGEVGLEELSQVAGEIGRKLLDKAEGEVGEENVNHKREEKNISEVDKLFAMLGQNHNSTQQHSPNLEIENNKQQIFSINKFSSANQLSTDITSSWFDRGVQQFEAGDFEQAIASYDQAIKFKPDFYEAWNSRGVVSCDYLGRFEEAIASFDKAVEIKPDYYEAWYNRGVALVKLERFEQAIASFDKTVEIKPDLHQAWSNRGFALSELGRFEQAIASFDKAVEFKPDYHDTWSNRGIALYRLERFEEAIASYDKVIEIKPDYHDAWYSRSFALVKLERFEQAIASFDKTVEIKPDLHQAWSNRGFALSELGRFEEAIESFDKAVEFKPDLHEAWSNRGAALGELGRFEEAIASYDKAVEIKADYHDAWLNRGGALFQLERFEEAIASYDKAVEIKPDLHEAWSNRGAALGELERFEEAIASFDKAVEIKPDYHDAWSNRGVALFQLLRFEEAIASYDKAVEIKPDFHQPWLNRGNAAGDSISFNQFFALPNSFTIKNPALNQRGYQGRLASFQEGLKYCQQNTHPEGWGMLHQAIGDAHYSQGVGEANYRQYWLQAEYEYKQALITLTPETFPELHLKVLQDLIRVLFGLNKNDEAKQYRRQALEVFAQLLNSADKSSLQKRQLQADFSGFSQMRVDILIEDGDFIPALEAAERNKNFYLTWILDNQKETIFSPSYSEIQELVNPNTAIIYWHLSPFALTTFIIKPGADKSIVISTQKPDKLEAWIKNWHKQYENYRKGKKQQSSNPAWRDNLPQLLEQLREILNIPHITETIQNLILIPHRDLHRFPLHALFPDNFTINYLPSAQIGLTLKSQSQQNIINPNLLIVEYSGAGREDEGLERLTYAEIESETIARIFENTNSKQISNNQANKNNLKQALREGYNIFHFSGHGSYDNKHPKNSAIYLSHDSTEEINPDLTLPEIRNLNLSGYHLVSLSACETAITGNEIEAEYVGLVSAFLYQGVSHVVSSLWTVNEISTSLLMIYFYRQIKKGKTPNIALAAATKWLRNLTYRKLERFYKFSFSKLSEGDSSRIVLKAYLESIKNSEDKLFNDPYYWAGFIITGV